MKHLTQPLRARFHLTATVQEPVGEGTAQKFRARIVKIDNAKLLEILGTATTNDFSGADLLADSSGFGDLGFSVVRGTNVIADVSSLFSRTGATGTFVVRGKQSSEGSVNVNRMTVMEYRFMPVHQVQIRQRNSSKELIPVDLVRGSGVRVLQC